MAEKEQYLLLYIAGTGEDFCSNGTERYSSMQEAISAAAKMADQFDETGVDVYIAKVLKKTEEGTLVKLINLVYGEYDLRDIRVPYTEITLTGE